MTNYLIPADLAAALERYLMRQPFGEVEQLIAAIRQMTPADAPTLPEEPKE